MNRLQKSIFLRRAKHFLEGFKSEEEQLEVMYELRSSYYFFIKYFFSHMTGSVYEDNYHIPMICECMEASLNHDISVLVINIPPNMSKTVIGTIGLVPFTWITRPHYKFIYASQDIGLALNNSKNCRAFIKNTEYSKMFKIFLDPDSANQKLFKNTNFGQRLTVSTSSNVTGHHGHVIVFDDPNDVTKVESAYERLNVIKFYANATASRNQISNASRIIIQQRVHMDDLSGYVLSLGLPNVVHLNLPMEFEKERKCIITLKDKKIEDPRTYEGELLWPNRWNKDYITTQKLQLGPLNYSTQYQQLPYKEGGTIFKKEYWNFMKIRNSPRIVSIIQSWDTALSTSKDSCYSACTTWGIVIDPQDGKEKAILLGVYKEKLEYPDLRHMAMKLSQNYKDTNLDRSEIIKPGGAFKAHRVLIEQKISGFSLANDLRNANIPVEEVNPTRYGPKLMRARLAAGLIESGSVLLPAMDSPGDMVVPLPVSSRLMSECAAYTGDKGSDVVDSLSQALNYMMDNNCIYNYKIINDDNPIQKYRFEHQRSMQKGY